MRPRCARELQSNHVTIELDGLVEIGGHMDEVTHAQHFAGGSEAGAPFAHITPTAQAEKAANPAMMNRKICPRFAASILSRGESQRKRSKRAIQPNEFALSPVYVC